MAYTGYLIIVEIDTNPNSPTFNETRERRVLSEECEAPGADWRVIAEYCELDNNGQNNGYRIVDEMDVNIDSDTYRQTRTRRELNLLQCPLPNTDPELVLLIDDSYCEVETFPSGLQGETGNFIAKFCDDNIASATYGQTFDEVLTIDDWYEFEEEFGEFPCNAVNTDPEITELSSECQTVECDGEMVTNGFINIHGIDKNPYSYTYLQTLDVVEEDYDRCPNRNKCGSVIINFINHDFTEGLTPIGLRIYFNGVPTYKDVRLRPIVDIEEGTSYEYYCVWDSSEYGNPSIKAMYVLPSDGNIIKVGTPSSQSQMVEPYLEYDSDYFTTGTRHLIHIFNDIHHMSKYLTFIALEDGTFSLTRGSQYSLDNGVTWVTLASRTQTPTVTAGNKIMFKSTIQPTEGFGIGTFSSTGRFNVQGNPLSMVLGDNFENVTDVSAYPWLFLDLFNGSKVVNASGLDLPYTTLSNACYFSMFQACEYLEVAPELPATTLTENCYNRMFAECFSLTTAPELPATTLVKMSYFMMFDYCMSLNYIKCLATDISAQDCTAGWVREVALSGTFVKDASMTSWTIGNNGIPTNWIIQTSDYLTFVPLMSTTFSFTNNVQYSVNNGTTWVSLAANTSTPTVTAGKKIMFKANLIPISGQGVGTFSSTGRFDVEGNPMSLLYGDDFEGKTDLTGKAYAFQKLFMNCANVVDASGMELVATTLSNRCYSEMFSNCTSLTTAPELPATTLAERSYYYMFNNCTSLTTAPALPATTLTEGCYWFMFNGCENLTTAPELPATTLAVACYYAMFYGCSSLNYVKCLATNISARYCTTNWVDGVASSGTFVKAASMTSWTTGASGIPRGWTIQNA